MELRDIEIFLTLARELHFGRTAARLHVSQARVSQAIKQQERRIGGLLFERSTRIVRLTPLGEQLLADLEPLYLGLHESLRRARQAAHARPATLTIGVVTSNAADLRPLWDAFRAQQPQWPLRIRHAPFLDWFDRLRAKEFDAVVTWLPVAEPDLTVGPLLFAERKMLIVPAGHALALRRSVDVEVLGDFGFLGLGAPIPEYWDDAYLPFRTPKGRTVERIGPVQSLDQILTDVANSEVLHVLGAHNARYHVRPDIVYVPIDGAGHLSWGLVWPSASESEPLRAFAAMARAMGPLPLRLE